MPFSFIVERRYATPVRIGRETSKVDLPCPQITNRLNFVIVLTVACRELVTVQKASPPMSNSERSKAHGTNETARKRDWTFVKEENFWICILLPVLVGMLLLLD